MSSCKRLILCGLSVAAFFGRAAAGGLPATGPYGPRQECRDFMFVDIHAYYQRGF
ncbi:MAG: hypothetical protein NTY45_08370 [Elusimicrobia bacterium]|nr:hypothetical protein [Elusimicrobiota bacterium]